MLRCMHNFLRIYDIGNGVPIQTIYDCASTLPEPKNHSCASFFLSLVRLAEFRARWSVYLNSESASKRNYGLKKISGNLRYLRETKISSRTTHAILFNIRSVLAAMAIGFIFRGWFR